MAQAGEGVGHNVPAPAGPDVVTGKARFTLDVAMEGMQHIKLLRSPHAHARIRSIDKTAALAVPGVIAVLTHEDAPTIPFSTARHEVREIDADDTMVLDTVVRYIGQRVAAVVADSEGAAEEACRRLIVDYEILPAVFDPEQAMQPGAPLLHDKGPGSAHSRPQAQSGRRRAWQFRRRRKRLCASRRHPRRHLLLSAHSARPSRNALRHRLDRRARPPERALQHAGAVPHAHRTGARVRARPGKSARVLRTRRRRLRRQAGNDGRGHRRAGGAENRQAGENRIHPRGTVHRRHHAPSDEGQGQDRRQEGRHPHRHADARHLQHRRLWQSRRAGAGTCLLGIDQRLRLREQESRWLRGLYQHRAGRRLSRLRSAADLVRDRAGDRRSRAHDRHRRARIPPPQRRAQGRADDRRACFARRRDLRQLRARSMYRSRRSSDEARRRRQSAGRLESRRRQRDHHDRHRAAGRALLRHAYLA